MKSLLDTLGVEISRVKDVLFEVEIKIRVVKLGLWVLVLIIYRYCFFGKFNALLESLPFWLRLPTIVGSSIGFIWLMAYCYFRNKRLKQRS